MTSTDREYSLLVVDDDTSGRESLQRIFEREHFRVHVAANGKEALRICRDQLVHVVLTDLMMPGFDGLELVGAITKMTPEVQSVVMTAYGTVEKAVQAMKLGAFDFVEKPLKRVPTVRAVTRAAERSELLRENQSLREELSSIKQAHGNQRPLLGNAPVFRRALEMAVQVAPTAASVLILGASGTGKENVARYIHSRSGREGPFVPVHLAALPETLVEAELFGHEKGAFTGADRTRLGRLGEAHGGTLFLDEVGELPPSVQVKLLRVLQEGTYTPLGGTPQHTDFRLVAATHRDLQERVEQGLFREDLYYRIHVISLVCPTLSERREDIGLLADHFVDLFRRQNGKPPMALGEEARKRLMNYRWPGNIRELQNAMERAVVLTNGDIIDVKSLPGSVTDDPPQDPLRFSVEVGTSMEEIERRAIQQAMHYTQGDKNLAARLLGISARTIYRRLEGGPEPVDSDSQGPNVDGTLE